MGKDGLVQRLAGLVFLIRVVSAVLAYGTQVLLARWMGGFEFGIYVCVWIWVLLLGSSVDLGLASAAQRLIPEYVQQNSLPASAVSIWEPVLCHRMTPQPLRRDG